MSARRFLPSASFVSLLFAAFAFPVASAKAATPAPLASATFAFPGWAYSPPSAVSAGLAFSDHWLGDGAFENPAVDVGHGLRATPLLLRVSRQDVASANRNVTQQQGVVDFGGATLATGFRGWSVALYAWQPALRVESQAFTIGRAASASPGGALVTDGSLRELRGGLALARGIGAWRVGVSGEFVRRDDDYSTIETSGSPTSGTREVRFSGDGLGGGVGLTWEHRPDERGGVRIGAAVHGVSSIDATGNGTWSLLTGDSTFDVKATRHGFLSGGATARVTVAPATRAFATLGGRGGETWDGFDVATNHAWHWGAGVDWRDPELTYAVRFGVGQEGEAGAPESRVGNVGAGFTWYSGGTVIDVGLLHRTLPRTGAPTSYEDRLLATLRVAF